MKGSRISTPMAAVPMAFTFRVSATSVKLPNAATTFAVSATRAALPAAEVPDGTVSAWQAEAGKWGMWIGAWGEHLPYQDNTVRLNKNKKDVYGLPTLDIDCSFRDNEMAMRKDMLESAKEMMEAAGLKNVWGGDDMPPPGHCIHEMGTARMGRDPKTSVLNGFNQMHAVKNVFISDGACMTSSACQNPSITYMALTARAADHAASELKKQNI